MQSQIDDLRSTAARSDEAPDEEGGAKKAPPRRRLPRRRQPRRSRRPRRQREEDRPRRRRRRRRRPAKKSPLASPTFRELTRRRDGASTPNSFGEGWPPAARRPRGRRRRSGDGRRRTDRPSRPGSSRPANRSRCSGRRRRFVSRGGDKLDAALDAVRHRRARCPRARRGRVDGWLHRLPAATGRRRMSSPSTSATANSTSGSSPTSASITRDRTNVRSLDAGAIGGPVDVVVADLSFISLRVVAPALLACARPGRRSGAAGEAAVRGHSAGGGEGARGDPRRGGARSGCSPR